MGVCKGVKQQREQRRAVPDARLPWMSPSWGRAAGDVPKSLGKRGRTEVLCKLELISILPYDNLPFITVNIFRMVKSLLFNDQKVPWS